MNWLKGELACCEGPQGRVLARREREDTEAMRMSHPVSKDEAFAWFGTFLGLFPPAAIFSRAFERGLRNDSDSWMLVACLVMNVICCVVGRAMGRQLSRKIGDTRQHGWVMTVLAALMLGFLWAVVTGAAGGVIVFGIGALFGPFFAAPVALVGFPAFMLLHRLLSRNGMIEERHLWPLAFGVPVVIAAVILSPSVFAY